MYELAVKVSIAEGVSAAVQNGADAVIVPLAEISGTGLSPEEFSGAAEFCRVRGVRIYVDADIPVPDDKYEKSLLSLGEAWQNGADAVIAGDAGFILAIRRTLPDMPVFAGTGLSVHDRDGLRTSAAMGASRCILIPQLTAGDISEICEGASIEAAVYAHGFMCAAVPGFCRFSSFTGSDDAVCTKPCLGEFECGVRDNHPFAMRDLCLADHLADLDAAGVSSIILSADGRRPEYAAILTSIYSRARSTGEAPDENDLALLSSVYPAAGYTDGYYTGKLTGLFGAAGTPSEGDGQLFSALRKTYLHREFQRVPIWFEGEVSLGTPLRLTAWDDDGHIVSGEGGKGELAFHREFTQTMLQTELFKTGGTPFLCSGVKCRIPRGISLDPADIAALRDDLLSRLADMRRAAPERVSAIDYSPVVPVSVSVGDVPVLTVSVLRVSQLSERILELAPPVIYIPIEEICSGETALHPYLNKEGVSICAVLPEINFPSEKGILSDMLKKVRQMGITEVCVSCLSDVFTARRMGFEVRGGLGIDIKASGFMSAVSGFGFKSVTLSPSLSAKGLAEIPKPVNCEYVIYGRLPIMHTACCLPKNINGVCSCDSFSGINDKDGFLMPVVRNCGCRNTVYSSRKRFLLKRSRDYMNAGLWGVRLMFTTENSNECAAIAERFLGLGTYEPASYTMGRF